MTAPMAEPPSRAYHLAMHSIAVHKNAAAISNTPETNEDLHQWDHNGPGGVRNHAERDLSYIHQEVECVLEEAEREEDGPGESPVHDLLDALQVRSGRWRSS